MSIEYIIPRPIRDVVLGPLRIANFKHQCENDEPGGALTALVGTIGGGFFVEPVAEKIIKAVPRVLMAGLGALAVYKLGLAIPAALIVGGIVSLPATALAVGSALLYVGVASTISSLTSGSLAALGIGLASAAAGWFCLEKHDIISFGLAELCLVEPLADNLKQPLLRSF